MLGPTLRIRHSGPFQQNKALYHALPCFTCSKKGFIFNCKFEIWNIYEMCFCSLFSFTVQQLPCCQENHIGCALGPGFPYHQSFEACPAVHWTVHRSTRRTNGYHPMGQVIGALGYLCGWKSVHEYHEFDIFWPIMTSFNAKIHDVSWRFMIYQCIIIFHHKHP
jgi:hypothetical protein